MADKKISQLSSSSTPLAGTEVLPIVQSGATVKVAVSDLTAGRAISASGVTISGQTASTLAAFDGSKNVVSVTSSATTPLAGTEETSIVQGGSAKKVTVGNLTAGRAVDGLSFSATGGLKNTSAGSNTPSATDGIFFTDGTADKNFIIQLDAAGSMAGWIYESGGAGWQKFLTASPAANVTVNTGNLVVGTAAKGIDFSANTGAAGETSSLLDWYEEGTWTPTITPSTSGAVTYTTQDGKYTRIGNLVVISFAVAGDKNTASGEFRIGGIPFSMVSTGGITGAINWYQPGGTALVNAVAFYFSTTAFRIGTLTAANVDATAGSYGDGLVSTTFSLTGSLFYFVS